MRRDGCLTLNSWCTSPSHLNPGSIHYFSRLNFKLVPQLDILSGSMLNVEDVLHRINLYYTLDDKKKERKLKLYSQDLREISVNTRPMYPASKISFNVANITKERFQFIRLKINYKIFVI